MGRNFNLTPEDFERIRKKKSLLKADIAYKASDEMEIPDLENNFTPHQIKKKEDISVKVVDLKKKDKNKSNKIL